MIRSRFLISAPMLSVLLATSACGRAGADAAGRDAGIVSEAEDAAALHRLAAAYDATTNSNDLDGYMALYAADAIQLPPGEPPIVGHEAIRTRAVRVFASIDGPVSSTVDGVEISGDLAVMHGSFAEPLKNARGESSLYVGHWLLMMKRGLDGGWRIHREIWNES